MKEICIHGRGGQGSLVLAQFMAIAALEDGKYGQAFPFLGGGGERRGKPIMAFCRLSDRPIRLRSRVSEADYLILQDATIVKEVNSTPPRIKTAFEKEFEVIGEIDLGILEGGYSIPDDPDVIRTLFEQMPPESRNKIIADSNGDAIYDTGIILIGITQDVNQEINQNDIDSLLRYLKNLNICDEDLHELQEAINKDGERKDKNFGERVKEWIGGMMIKAAQGVWKIGQQTIPSLLTTALSHYYGWK